MSTYERRKMEKKCANCGVSVSGKYTYCGVCKEKIRELQKAEYAEKRRLCLCVRCGKNTEGKAYCPECLAVERAKKRMRYRNMKDDERKALYLKNLRYLAEHPEKKALYASRRSEYQRRYFSGEE